MDLSCRGAVAADARSTASVVEITTKVLSLTGIRALYRPRYLKARPRAKLSTVMSRIQELILDYFRRAVRAPRSDAQVVLGLDVSSVAVGAVRVSGAGRLTGMDVVTAPPRTSEFKIAAAVSKLVEQSHSSMPIEATYVEEPLKSFATGRFHTQGLFKLAGLNAIVAYECWRLTGRRVTKVSAVTVRRAFEVSSDMDGVWPAAGTAMRAYAAANAIDDEYAKLYDPDAALTLLRKSRTEADLDKLNVLRTVTTAFPSLATTWTRTRTGTLTPTCFDRADALLVAMYGATELRIQDVLRDADVFRTVAEAHVRARTSMDGSGKTPALRRGRKVNSQNALSESEAAELLARVMQQHAKFVKETAVDEGAGEDEDEAAEQDEPAERQTRKPRSKSKSADETSAEHDAAPSDTDEITASVTEAIRSVVRAHVCSPPRMIERLERNAGLFSL